MNKPKAILFDLGDTIIQYSDFNPSRGNKELLKYYKNNNSELEEEINLLGLELSKSMNLRRDETNLEYTCQNFQRLLFALMNVELDLTPLEMEQIFNKHAYTRIIMPGLIAFLDFLKREEIRIAVLSNSSFSGEVLEGEMKVLSIREPFEFVVSTADYCLRKPDPRIFKVCLNKLNLNSDEVWYVGNKLEYDVLGANNAGMQAIWLNRFNEENSFGYDCKIVRNYMELETLISSCDIS
ncbi:HAD family hydrolase [Fusibacter bizertensis]